METPTPDREAQLAEVLRLRREGIIATKKQRKAEAGAFHHEALRLHEDVLGMEDPAVLESLDALLFFCSRYGQQAEALAVFERCLPLMRQKPPPKYRGTLRLLDTLAFAHYRCAEYAKAEQCYEWSIAARELVLGPNHPKIAATLENYATLLRETGRNNEAEALTARAQVVRNSQPGIRKKQEGEHNGTGDA